jgi:hypothetical protein
MPTAKLAHQARKAGLRKGSKRYNAYVYGTEAKIKRACKLKRSRAHRS